MKKWLLVGIFLGIIACRPVPVQGQILLLVKNLTEKIIKAIDLKMQRLQTQTIALQNAQRGVENEMHRLKLNDISLWAQKQRDLYQGYYTELWQVKAVITSLSRVRKAMALEQTMVSDYHRAWSLVSKDKNFTPAELNYMSSVYTGILNNGLKVMDQLSGVISSGRTSMTDASRMALIEASTQELQTNVDDLHEFTNQNELLSVERGKTTHQENVVRSLYGL